MMPRYCIMLDSVTPWFPNISSTVVLHVGRKTCTKKVSALRPSQCTVT